MTESPQPELTSSSTGVSVDAIALAQNARHLATREILSGWLHLTTRNLAAKLVRSEERRRAREREAVAMETESAEPEHAWSRVAPQLDEAIGCLSENDRDANQNKLPRLRGE